MATDDAGLNEKGACQVESWLHGVRGGAELWLVPACNFTGNLELSVGGARQWGSADAGSSAIMQAKTLFRPLDTNGWGIGLVAGNLYRPRHGLAGDLYAYLPVSWSFRDDGVLVHANLGWLREREGQRERATWGVGSEIRLGQRSWVTVEGFGQDRGRPLWQVGTRHWVVRDRVQLDASVGSRLGQARAGRWFTLGLKFVTSPLWP